LNRILLMGAPGSGKGTQATRIAEHYGVPAISTGDIFRANVEGGTPLGETARGYIEAGEYVPDSVTNAMVRGRLGNADCRRGFLLDGYPRTLAQVATLDAILADSGRALEAVVALEVADEELVDRLVRRAATEGRVDDCEDVIRRRQKLYADETAPLLAEYERRDLLVRVDGSGAVDEVADRVFAALGIRA
jgi:adenylate kinase